MDFYKMKYKIGQKVIFYQITPDKYIQYGFNNHMNTLVGKFGIITSSWSENSYFVEFGSDWASDRWVIYEGDLKVTREEKFKRILND